LIWLYLDLALLRLQLLPLLHLEPLEQQALWLPVQRLIEFFQMLEPL
jgi:hypothetical protein